MVVYGTVDVAWIRCGKVQFTLDLREGESSGGGTGWGLDSLSDIFCLLCGAPFPFIRPPLCMVFCADTE